MGYGSYSVIDSKQRQSSTYEAETNALLARMTSEPNGSRKAEINQLIRQLKSGGIWDELDCLWVLAAHDQQAAYLNWKGDSNNITNGVAPTFTVDRGIVGNGTTQYVNTNYNPTTNGVKYTLNNASYGAYCRTNSSTNSIMDIGVTSGSDLSNMNIRNAAGDFSLSLNASAATTKASADSLGLHSAVRTDASTISFYKNGSSLGSSATASTAKPNGNFFILARNSSGSPAGFTTRQIAFAYVGSGAINQSDFYSYVQIYMTAIGANV